MENKINNLNHSAFQPAFISRIPIHPTFDYRLFSNKAGSSIGSFQCCDQVHLNGVPSDSNYGILISSSVPNQFTYRKFDFTNLHTIDSMFIPAKDGVVSSLRGGVLESVHWPPNEVGTNDQCQVLENINENVKAVLYSELPCIAADNRHIGPINLPNISIMDQGKKLKKSRMVREKWKTEENMKLVRFVEKHGEKQWSKISQSMSGRTGKQCRERWHNHVKPNIKKIDWTDEEDNALVEGLKKYKNKWVKIAKQIPGRTENQLKNRWHNIIRSVQPRPESSRKIKQAKCSKILKDYARMCTGNEAAASTSNAAEGSISGISNGLRSGLARVAATLMEDVSLEDQMKVDEASLREHYEDLRANL